MSIRDQIAATERAAQRVDAFIAQQMPSADFVGPPTWQQYIARLAELPAIEYDRRRDDEARRLGIRVSTLDAEIKKLRNDDDTKARGRKIELYEPVPWPESVNGAEVLDDIYSAIKRHMAIRDEYAITVTLWATHTHVFNLFDHTSRLGITAPNEECGKTLLERHLIGPLVPRPQPVELMKAAPFFRLCEEYKPTFLIDEIDVFIKEDSDLLAAINNGWEPHGGVPRCVGEGTNMEVRIFSTHCPVAIGGINIEKVLPPTTLSRTLIISLERAVKGEIETDYNSRIHRAGLLELGRKLARWCADNRLVLSTAEPVMLEGMSDRRAEKWFPLFAIAEVAGGDWPERARRAFLAEDAEGAVKVSTSIQLLSDIRDVLKNGEDKIHTHTLIDRLCRIEDSRWSDHNYRERDEERRKIQPRQLGALLAGYKIKSHPVRIGTEVKKGYNRSDIENACQRYLRGVASDTGLQSNSDAGFSEVAKVTQNKGVTHEKPLEGNDSAECNRVTDTHTPDGKVGNDDAWRADI